MENQSQSDQEISKLLDLTQDLINLDKLDDAEIFLNEIVKYKPNEINLFFLRGKIFSKRSYHEKALEQFMIVNKMYPRLPENLHSIAQTYYSLKKYDDAIEYYKQYLKLKPHSDSVLAAIATCLFRKGDLDNSIRYFKQVLAISPQMEHVHSNILLAMIYAESISPDQLKEEAEKFGNNLARIYPDKIQFTNDHRKDRKIKIGYVSPDFRDHPIPYFLEPVLKYHDKHNFEIYAYSSTLIDNPVMGRMKEHVDFWRDIRNLGVEESHKLIVQDKIDILIDMAGHTAHNNLKVFAKRAAPIQATWLGFPATTGVQTIDYRITDFYAEPPGMTEHLNTEELWRLPNIFCVYSANENSPKAIDHPPLEDNGYVTFGCFNNFVKVRDPVLAAWSKIIEQVTNCRLLLEIEDIDDPKLLGKIQERLHRQNIPLNRVTLEPRKRSNQFFLYNKIDIALDPFPCAGGTTSMDALWMGVPVITMSGGHFASRLGVTILNNAGLPELIAKNIEEYISLAVHLATDQSGLKNIRDNLRARFANSPAMDHKGFTRDIEAAYREMWHKYCNSKVLD